MATIIGGYVAGTENGNQNRGLSKRSFRDWWLVTETKSGRGYIGIKIIKVPREWIGKRVRFKVELVPDNNSYNKEN